MVRHNAAAVAEPPTSNPSLGVRQDQVGMLAVFEARVPLVDRHERAVNASPRPHTQYNLKDSQLHAEACTGWWDIRMVLVTSFAMPVLAPVYP